MKQFLLKSFVFGFVCILALGCLDFGIQKLPNDLSTKLNLLQKGDAEVIFLGSSHTYFGVNPAFFDCKAINLAYASQGLEHDHHIITSNTDKLSNCKYLAIEVSYHSFPYFAHLNEGGIEASLYNHFWDYEIYYSDDLLKNQFALFSVGIDQAINRLGKNLLGVKANRDNEWGWAPRLKQVDLTSSAIEDTDRHNEIWQRAEADSLCKENLGYIEELIQIAQKNNIEPILFNTPIATTYKERIDPEALKKYYTLVEGIQQKHQLKFIDYIKNQGQFDNQDFSDSDHLNPKAAEKFSIILNKLICNN